MFDQWNRNISALSVCLILVVSASESTQANCNSDCCHPASPPACAADGVCRPLSDWGVATTRWRRWPGDIPAQGPTTIDQKDPEGNLILDPLQLPNKEQEDLRGPVKKEPPKSEDTEESAVIPEAPLMEEKGVEALGEVADPLDFEAKPENEGGQDIFDNVKEEEEEGDIFDFGARPNRVPREDAPPTLPPSLQGFSSTPRRSFQKMSTVPVQNRVILPATMVSPSRETKLVNPASANFSKANAGVQNAVFVGDRPAGQ